MVFVESFPSVAEEHSRVPTAFPVSLEKMAKRKSCFS